MFPPGWAIVDERAALLAHARELEAMAKAARHRAMLLGWMEETQARVVVEAGGQAADLARRLSCDRVYALRVAQRAKVKFQAVLR